MLLIRYSYLASFKAEVFKFQVPRALFEMSIEQKTESFSGFAVRMMGFKQFLCDLNFNFVGFLRSSIFSALGLCYQYDLKLHPYLEAILMLSFIFPIHQIPNNITFYSCKHIPDVQAYKCAYYLHPMNQYLKETKTTFETRLIVNKQINIEF